MASTIVVFNSREEDVAIFSTNFKKALSKVGPSSSFEPGRGYGMKNSIRKKSTRKKNVQKEND